MLKVIFDKKDESFDLREASRAVLFDKDNLVPLLFVSKFNYHKLPGGGIEIGEDKIKALRREVKEETGCAIEIFDEVGEIQEYRSEFNLKQISYCYLGSVLSKGIPHFEKGEVGDGFKLVWVTLDKGIAKMKKDRPSNYEGKFIQERDLSFLQTAKGMVKHG